MKRFSKLVLVVVSLISMTIPAWGQTSTQGKEFWVSLVPGQYAEADKAEKQKASSSSNKFQPYIAISAQKACTVEISNPRTGWTTGKISVNANEWKEIGKNGEIPIIQWYTPDAMPTSETAYDMGLKVEASENVSVYCSLRWGYSADATNILPINALQSEYIVQTYEAIKQNITYDGSSADSPKTEGNDFNGVQKNSFTILAAEDCVVDVDLTASTSGGHSGKITGITLSQGQVYHVLSAVNESLSGSRVTARDGKKIAVFAGAPSTRLPNAFSDRDLLYEQLFPIDYWGQHFIVVRSKQKDANRIIITAQVDNTEVTIHGQYDPSTSKFEDHTIQKDYKFTLQAGKSYEFEMSSGYADNRWDKKRSAFKNITVIDTAAFISTSCPCAVVSYDVGSKYIRQESDDTNPNEAHLTEAYHTHKNDGKIDEVYGAPAMTWIAPIEQMLNDVVFGVMGSDEVTRHFVNIVIEKRDLPYIKLNGASLESSFREVESNKDYYYARLTLDETDPDGKKPNPFYHLESKYGFIATVYGNGHNESYAYTAGSSAVEYGVVVDGEKFIDGYRSDNKFCLGTDLEFNAKIGTDVITRVDWDFGDGVTQDYGNAVTTHKYTAEGWYDVTADLYGHQACSGQSNQYITSVSFSFLVWRPEKRIGSIEPRYIEADSTINGIKLTPDQVRDSLLNGTVRIDTPDYCYEDTIVHYLTYCLKTKDKRYGQDTIGFDQIVLNDSTYTLETLPPGGIIEWTETNYNNCDSLFRFHAIIRTCLDIVIPNNLEDQHICLGEKSMSIGYNKIKGDIDGDTAVFTIAGMPSFRKTIKFQQANSIDLPLDGLTRPGYYTGKIAINDANCMNDESHPEKPEFELPIDFAVNYPDTIFDFLFANVLAVRKDLGYNFKHYQWYINDRPVGGDVSVLYLGENVALVEGVDNAYVVITDNNGMVLKSCPQTVQYYNPAPSPNRAPVRKVMQNQHIYILRDEHVYDMFGQKVK